MKDIVLVDKDDTLGVAEGGGYRTFNMFHGAPEFLQWQRDEGRIVHVATNAGAAGRIHLKEIEELFSKYFGREFVSTEDHIFYLTPRGRVRNVRDDYDIHCDGKVFRSVDDLCLFGEAVEFSQLPDVGFVHRKTGEKLDKSNLYQNPYFGKGVMKDLYLARRFAGGKGYENARIVLVGDNGNAIHSVTDPMTPIICVGIEPNWKKASFMLDKLFSKGKPADVFDELFESAKEDDKNRKLIMEYSYSMKKRDSNGRECRVIF